MVAFSQLYVHYIQGTQRLSIMSDQSPISVPLLQLPLHLLSILLRHLDSIQSLGSAILSHSSLYTAFIEDQKSIIWNILTNQIDPDVMVFAMAAYKASFLKPDDSEGLRPFLEDHFGPDRSYQVPTPCYIKLGELTPSIANELSKAHVIVEHFSNALIKDMLPLAQQQLGLQRANLAKVSPREKYRIYRAFYRYQFYCNLVQNWDANFKNRRRFGWKPVGGDLGTLHIWLQQYSRWVNEQVTCVLDFLNRKVLSPGMSSACYGRRNHKIGCGSSV